MPSIVLLLPCRSFFQMASVRRFARAAQFALATTSVWAYVLFPAPVQAVGFEACERPSCASKDDIFRMMREAEGRASSRETQAVGSGASTSAAGDIAPHANKAELKDCDCPPDRAELGFHSWQLVSFSILRHFAETGITTLVQLHSVAANFPDHPSEREQEACTNLFSALGELYPCRHCSAHLKHSLETSPPQ